MTHLANRLRTWHEDEAGATETVAFIFLVPIIIVLILGAVNLGMMFSARLQVENVAQDAVRRVASEGGDRNPRSTTLPVGETWSSRALEKLWNGSKCTISACTEGDQPSVECSPSVSAEASGDPVYCRVIYPYQPISANLMGSGMDLGFGGYFTQPFDITVAGRAETGDQG